MKFIRKNGRVIPIKDKGDSSAAKKPSGHTIGGTAKLAAAGGALSGAANAGLLYGALKPKHAAFAAAAGAAISVVAGYKSIFAGVAAKKGEKLKTFGKHYLASLGGAFAGGALGGIGIVGLHSGVGKLAAFAKNRNVAKAAASSAVGKSSIWKKAVPRAAKNVTPKIKFLGM